MKNTTDKKLRQQFDKIDERFFDNRLDLINVQFKDIVPDGMYDMRTGEITIDSKLRKHITLVLIVLLHEMAHASLDLQGYRGYHEDGGHGGLFQAELDRLYRAGAFDGLL
jgi:hypothetical protein